MRNKNANCSNIEKNFKYNTVIIITLSDHITIFRILSIDIWQLKCQQTTNKLNKNMVNVFLHKIIKFFFLFLLREDTLESKVVTTNSNSSAFLLPTFSTSSCFPFFHNIFLELIIAFKIKRKLLKQSAVLFTSCQKNIAYIWCLNIKNIVHK